MRVIGNRREGSVDESEVSRDESLYIVSGLVETEERKLLISWGTSSISFMGGG